METYSTTEPDTADEWLFMDFNDSTRSASNYSIYIPYGSEYISHIIYHKDKLTEVLKYIYPIIIIAGFILNCVAAIGLLRQRMLKQHHTTVYLISIFLSCAYILASQISAYTAYHLNLGPTPRWVLPVWLCKIWSFIDVIVWASMGWQLVVLMVDRIVLYGSRCWPDSSKWNHVFRKFCTRRSALFSLLAVLNFCFWPHVYVLRYYGIDSRDGSCHSTIDMDQLHHVILLRQWLRVVEEIDRIPPCLTLILGIMVFVLLRLSKKRSGFTFTPVDMTNSDVEAIERRYTILDLTIVTLNLTFRLLILIVQLIEMQMEIWQGSFALDVIIYFASDVLLLFYCLMLVINPLVALTILVSLRDELYRVFIAQPARVCSNCTTTGRGLLRRRTNQGSSPSVRFSWSPYDDSRNSINFEETNNNNNIIDISA